MSDHSSDEEQQYEAPRITDKRKMNQKAEPAPAEPLPTAEELLTSTGSASEFEKQAAENVDWDNLSEEEKQAILARQAEAEAGLPFSGGGLQTPGETTKEVLTVFAIVVDLDGTATAMPLGIFDEQVRSNITFELDATSRIMYRSCSEICMDVAAAETAHLTVQFLKTVGEQQALAHRAQALQEQLKQRGVRAPRR